MSTTPPRPAPGRTEWVLPGLAGALFTSAGGVAVVSMWRQSPGSHVHAGAIAVLALFAILPLVGLGLTSMAAVSIARLLRMARASTVFAATIVEVRVQLIAGIHGGTRSRWVVVARGQWPADGSTRDFDSDESDTNVSDRYRPGQNVDICADLPSGLYRIDLTTVSGIEQSVPDIAGPDRSASYRTNVRPPVQAKVIPPKKGLAVSGAVVVAASLVAIAVPVLRPMAVIVAMFSGLIAGIIYLSLRQARQLGLHGVTFPVTVSKIVHERKVSGQQVRDDWRVLATGTWPDGISQDFTGVPALDPGSLARGDTVWIRGDLGTRLYELQLTQA